MSKTRFAPDFSALNNSLIRVLASIHPQRRPWAVIGSGTAATEIAMLVESLQVSPRDLTVIYRAETMRDLHSAHLLQELCANRDVGVHLVLALGGDDSPFVDRQRSDVDDEARLLSRKVENLRRAEIYLCGPEPWVAALDSVSRDLGVSHRRIHVNYAPSSA